MRDLSMRIQMELLLYEQLRVVVSIWQVMLDAVIVSGSVSYR